MDIATRTLMVTLPVADAGFLKKQAHRMGWQIVRMPRVKSVAVVQDETGYLLSSKKMTNIIQQGLADANRGNYQIVDIDAL